MELNKRIFGKLLDWKKLDDLIPKNFKDDKKPKTGTAVFLLDL